MSIEKYVPLKEIVNLYIDESRQTQADFRRLWVLAFRGLVDMGFNTMWEPKTVRIPVEGNLTAKLPADYLNWVKIGILNSFGEIATLSVNKNLTTYHDLQSDRLTAIGADIPSIITTPYYLNFLNGYEYRHLFGVPLGLLTAGTCRVDEQNKVIIFNPEFDFEHIMLEYLSAPQQNGDYSVDIRFQEALISWLRWKDVISAKVPVGDIQRRRREYFDDLKKSKRFQKPFRLQEFEDAIRQNSNFKLKA